MKSKKRITSITNQFKFSIQEITLAGIFVGLWIISSKFLTIDFGIMRAGIVYVWAILIGLTTKPALGVMTAIVADTVSQAISNYGISQWMWEYAIIYPGITLFASLFKHSFKLKNNLIWWMIMLIINFVAIGGAIFISIYKDGFKYESKNNANEAIFDFTSQSSKIIIWTCAAIMIVFCVALISLAALKPKYRKYLAIYSLAAATIIFFIWVWGPIAQIRYLIRFVGTKSNGEYWKLHDVYLISRVLKTPIILPLYTGMITTVYVAYEQIQKHTSAKNRW